MRFLGLVIALSVALMIASQGAQSDLLETVYTFPGCSYNIYGSGPRIDLYFFGVVPQLCPHIPEGSLFMYFPNGAQVSQGNQLNTTQVANAPNNIQMLVNDPSTYYTGVLVDIDEPQPNFPVERQYLLWLVINISGRSLESGGYLDGETIVPYQGPNPTLGNHRIAFVLIPQPYGTYQPAKGYPSDRAHFCLEVYRAENNLPQPDGANFFMCQANGNR